MARNLWLLIFLTCGLGAHDKFWFSYKIVTLNKLVVYEERNISPLMTPNEVQKKKFLCRFQIEKKEDTSDTQKTLNRYYDDLLQCFYPMASKVINRTHVELKGVKETSQVVITPTRFTVDFNNQFANIFLLSQ